MMKMIKRSRRSFTKDEFQWPNKERMTLSPACDHLEGQPVMTSTGDDFESRRLITSCVYVCTLKLI